MKIICIADQHENLPVIPKCDLLINAGDVSFAPFGALRQKDEFLSGSYAKWMLQVPCMWSVLVAGNHDQSIEALGVPVEVAVATRYLEDENVTYGGLKIWGTPWQPWFGGWAFNAPEHDRREYFLTGKFAAIPDDTDIIVCHGPPYGAGDKTRFGEHVGSRALYKRILEVRPKLVVCGHIHPSYGVHNLDGIPVVNAALVDETYTLVNEPIEVVL
jgi:Icc-related predicted phosphoesterase